MADRHAPGCVCEPCWPLTLQQAIGAGLVARVRASFDPPPAAPRPRTKIVIREVVRWRARRPRPRVDQAPTPAPEVVQAKAEPPLVVAPEVDDVPAPEPVARPRRVGRPRKVAAPDRDVNPDNITQPTRTCRVCGATDADAWAQADLCSSAECLTEAARHGRDRAQAQRAPAAARAKRRSRIARLAGRLDRATAAAERAADTHDDDEDLEPRLERVPEVDVDA